MLFGEQLETIWSLWYVCGYAFMFTCMLSCTVYVWDNSHKHPFMRMFMAMLILLVYARRAWLPRAVALVYVCAYAYAYV
jgi:hypothetical protein